MVGRTVVSNGGKRASMTPHTDDDEKGANGHLIYCIFSCIMKIHYIDDIMRPRIFIGDWNGYSSDEFYYLIVVDICSP